MSSKTFFSRQELQGSKSSKNKKFFWRRESFKYLSFQEVIYKLRDVCVSFLDKINYYDWRRLALLKTVDLLWEGSLTGLGLWLLLQENHFLKGPGIALLLWIAMSYLQDVRREFAKKY